MATIKSFTDISQSKKLAKILPLESADMHYYYDYNFNELESIPAITEEDDHFVLFPKDVRCWSLAVLLNILHENKICHYNDRYYCQYIAEGSEFPIYSTAEYDNPIDACYELILKLHELKML